MGRSRMSAFIIQDFGFHGGQLFAGVPPLQVIAGKHLSELVLHVSASDNSWKIHPVFIPQGPVFIPHRPSWFRIRQLLADCVFRGGRFKEPVACSCPPGVPVRSLRDCIGSCCVALLHRLYPMNHSTRTDYGVPSAWYSKG